MITGGGGGGGAGGLDGGKRIRRRLARSDMVGGSFLLQFSCYHTDFGVDLTSMYPWMGHSATIQKKRSPFEVNPLP